MSTALRFSPARAAGGNPFRVLVLLAFVVFGAVGGAVPAWAHAQLLGSTPANGGRLAAAPAEVRLRFSERVHPVPSGLSLLDVSGKTLYSGTASATPAAPSEVVWRLPGTLPDGVYAVLWRVVSADSHPINGALSFSVGVAAPAPLSADGQTGPDRGVSLAFWALRWLGYAGLAAFAGGVLVLWRCWPGGWASRRARRTLLAGWAVSVGCAVGVFLLQGPYSAGATLGRLFSPDLIGSTLDSGYGVLVLARLALLCVAGWLALRTARARPPLVAIAGVALPATWAGAGHAASGNLETLAVDALHLAAMSAWLGGLALLWTALFARPVGEVAGVLRRFSPMAMACVAILVVTGVYQAWRGVGSLEAMSGSDYGRVLLFKLAAIAMLLWFGALSNAAARRAYASASSLDVAPAPAMAMAGGRIPAPVRRPGRVQREAETAARTSLRRTVRIEALIAVAVLGLTSVLVSTPPADSAAPSSAAGELPLAGGGQVRVLIEPARVGASRMSVSVHDSGGREWDVPEVTAALDLPARRIGPMRVTLLRQQPGRYASQSLTLPIAGDWRVRVGVRTSEIDMQTVETHVSVA